MYGMATLEQARVSMKDVAINETFFLKDLFRGLDFNRLSKSQRIHLGISFSDMIKREYGESFIISTKISNQIVYQRIK